jgi:hypothetical protein
MTEDDIDEAVWRVIAARLANDVMRFTDADVLMEDAVRRHCLAAARTLQAGINFAVGLDMAGAKGDAVVQYSSTVA